MKIKKLFNENYLYITLFKKIRINLLLIPLFYSAYSFGFTELLILSYITAVIHECFHIIAMCFLHIPIKKVDIQPFGVCVYLKNVSVFSSYKEAIVAISGPLFNFLAALALTIIKPYFPSHYLDFTIYINLAMGVFNLIPALPLDGGRVLKSLLSINFGIIKAYNFMLTLSRAIIFAILAISIILLLFTSFNFSLILIGIFLLSNITYEEKNLNHIILKDILYSKEQNKLKTPLNTKVFTVSSDIPARCILKLLSFDYCIELLITDYNGRIIYYATETEIINLLIKKGIRAKFSELY